MFRSARPTLDRRLMVGAIKMQGPNGACAANLSRIITLLRDRPEAGPKDGKLSALFDPERPQVLREPKCGGSSPGVKAGRRQVHGGRSSGQHDRGVRPADAKDARRSDNIDASVVIAAKALCVSVVDHIVMIMRENQQQLVGDKFHAITAVTISYGRYECRARQSDGLFQRLSHIARRPKGPRTEKFMPMGSIKDQLGGCHRVNAARFQLRLPPQGHFAWPFFVVRIPVSTIFA